MSPRCAALPRSAIRHRGDKTRHERAVEGARPRQLVRAYVVRSDDQPRGDHRRQRPSVLALRLAPGQERFVSSVADSLEKAAENPHGNPWCRAVCADRQPVGFVMLSWDVEPGRPRSTAHGSLGSCSSTTGNRARATAGKSCSRSWSSSAATAPQSCSPAMCQARAARPASTRSSGSPQEETWTPTGRSSCDWTCEGSAGPEERGTRSSAEAGLCRLDKHPCSRPDDWLGARHRWVSVAFGFDAVNGIAVPGAK